MDVEGSTLIQKTILNLKNVRATEWITSAELEVVIDRPDRYVIQSFLVRYRIFLYKSWKAMITLFLFYTWDSNNIIWQLRNEGRFVDIFEILWGLLEIFCRFYSGENSILNWMTNKVIQKLIWVFSCLEKNSPDFLTKEIIKTSLDLIESATISHCIDLYPLIRLAEILLRLPQTLKEGALETLSELRDNFGRNLLHVALFFRQNQNLFSTIRLLLNAGCNPTAVDVKGNAPLHYLVQFNDQVLNDLNNIVHLLLDFGSQLSLKNSDGKMAVELWMQQREIRKQYNPHVGESSEKNDLPNWFSAEIPKLSLLSARIIRCYRIPYSVLPATLLSSIEKHKIR